MKRLIFIFIPRTIILYFPAIFIKLYTAHGTLHREYRSICRLIRHDIVSTKSKRNRNQRLRMLFLAQKSRSSSLPSPPSPPKQADSINARRWLAKSKNLRVNNRKMTKIKNEKTFTRKILYALVKEGKKWREEKGKVGGKKKDCRRDIPREFQRCFLIIENYFSAIVFQTRIY